MSTTSSAMPPPPKQLRFINNEGHPPAKRRRINAACWTCRGRKTRCDGKRPHCSTCLANNHECFGYSEAVWNSNKREHKESDIRSENQDGESVQPHEKGPGSHINKGSREAIQKTWPEHRRTESKSSGVRDSEKPSITVHGNDYRESAGYSDDGPNPANYSPALPSSIENRRVPFFRYFGPTAIVPGFKQMVVSVREHRRITGAGPNVAMPPGGSVVGADSSSVSGTKPRAAVDMPLYDPDDPLPVNRLIIHLVETFFAYLGCNYLFLRQKRFIQQVEEKSVEPILVDAVCALAARFSDHPLLVGSHNPSYLKSNYGNAFAQRAKAALVDHFPRPSVAATQACLLLTYEGFGANQDSALWMYLGCAIRMAVDLGLQKIDGVKHKDHVNHRMSDTRSRNRQPTISEEGKREMEQERIDTFWAVFMLDRVISSGTGRPVTLKDEDVDLTFPAITSNLESGWPNPFPALIRIIHLYGRVCDLLNNIRNAQDVTTNIVEGLSEIEKDLTQLFQRLDQRLTFNAENFQHYVKSGEGTNFLLVHFWFHTLIMLLHQPQLMNSFEEQVVQLFPNSRKLSMSSAKTIADILAYAEVIDPRSFIGNPFTSQPIYIAACAFLMETATHTSQPSSRATGPGRTGSRSSGRSTNLNGNEGKDSQKRSLLAAANNNYERCHKALQSLETYWGGTRYILVTLDQKSRGIWDPEIYTEQEYEFTRIKHDMMPSWRSKLSMTSSSPSRLGKLLSPRLDAPRSPSIDPTHAIGWSLTGMTNSPHSNLTFMYQNTNGEDSQPPSPPKSALGNMIYDPIRGSLPEISASTSAVPLQPSYNAQPWRHPSPPMLIPKFSALPSDPATTSEAEMLLGLQNSPFAHPPGPHNSCDSSHGINSPINTRQVGAPLDFSGSMMSSPSYIGLGAFGDVVMESQDIDMSTIGGDMMPWLEYLPGDFLDLFYDGNNIEKAGSGSLNGGVDLTNMSSSGT